MNILVIQSHPADPPGILGERVLERGGVLDIVMPLQGDLLPPTANDHDGLILMGGAMNAEDDAHYPHLAKSVQLIREFHAQDKPILGVCLGSQLIARAFGRRVYPHTEMELGFLPVQLTAAAATDPLLGGCPQTLHLMQWHEDTFDLPAEATLLMTGERCDRQAYKIGNTLYAFQFHLEVTEPILQSWLTGAADFLQSHAPDFPKKLAEQIPQFLEESQLFCRMVGDRWLDQVVEKTQITL